MVQALTAQSIDAPEGSWYSAGKHCFSIFPGSSWLSLKSLSLLSPVLDKADLTWITNLSSEKLLVCKPGASPRTTMNARRAATGHSCEPVAPQYRDSLPVWVCLRCFDGDGNSTRVIMGVYCDIRVAKMCWRVVVLVQWRAYLPWSKEAKINNSRCSMLSKVLCGHNCLALVPSFMRILGAS